MRKLYVTWQNTSGGFEFSEVEVEGKVNRHSVQLAVIKDLSFYHQEEFQRIIAWSDMEEFTSDEKKKFWEDYQNYTHC